MFCIDLALQQARDRQASLLRAAGGRRRPHGHRRGALRLRLGTWIIRLGLAVRGGAFARPARPA